MSNYTRKTKTYTCYFSNWARDEKGMPYRIPDTVRFRVPMERYEWFLTMIDQTRPDYDRNKALDAFDEVLSDYQRKIKKRHAKKTNSGYSSGFDD